MSRTPVFYQVTFQNKRTGKGHLHIVSQFKWMQKCIHKFNILSDNSDYVPPPLSTAQSDFFLFATEKNNNSNNK